jgi:hypothetical protein
MDHRLADVGYQCWRTILPEETLAMKLGFVIPIVGPANRAHARLRGPGERANAQLKYWRILHKVCVSPRGVGRLAKAIHVLQNYEATRG